MPKIKAELDKEKNKSYEIKKKKKKKIKSDPLEEETGPKYSIVEVTIKQEFQPELFDDNEAKVENIEVAIDCTELLENGMNYDSQDNAEVNNGEELEEADAAHFLFNENGFLPPMNAATTFICNICNLVFSNERTLRTHKNRAHDVYKNKLEYKCKYCDSAYEKDASLKVHIKRKHLKSKTEDDREIRVCDLCASAFVGKARLAMHKHRKHGSLMEDFLYECDYCGLSYGKHSSLVAHMKRKHKTKKTISQLYKCPFCPKSFYVKASLMTHVKRNHKLNKECEDNEGTTNVPAGVTDATRRNVPVAVTEYGDVVCEVCSVTFASTRKLKIHMRRKHGSYQDIFKLQCAICNLSYEKMSSLRRHLKRKHDPSSYCQTCQIQFESHDLYLNHTHGSVTVFDCTECGKIFETQKSYARHVSIKHHKDTPDSVYCDTCGKGFRHLRILKDHLNTHLDKKYNCAKCGKKFKTLDSLRHHVRTHSDNSVVADYSCTQCDNKFGNERDLCSHIELHHAKNIKQEAIESKYNCTKCTHVFPSWNLLNEHNNTVHLLNSEDYKWVTCKECDEKVTVKSMTRHMKSHVNFKCDYCEFETKSPKLFTIHMLKHDVETLTCGAENCSYSTNNASQLVIHSKIHVNNTEQYQCHYCPFTTFSKYTIKYHENEHKDGKRLYKCEICPYSTFRQPNFFQHKTKHSLYKQYKCESCPFETKYNQSLAYHIKTKHPDLPTTAYEMVDNGVTL